MALEKNYFNLESCSEMHLKCRPATPEGSWIPSRLIHVGPRERGCAISLRERADVPSESRYATLSHCWGTHPIYTLRMDRLTSFLNEIPTKQLPKTFLDAIQVTQDLGLEYLWIDSLCIIQDSEEDWLREASAMGDVYKNGWINIAATALSDSQNGMFASQDVRPPELVTVQTTWKGLGDHTFFCVDSGSWDREVVEKPLNDRAWVFQERVLSPRILHFAKAQLFWECRETEACEQFPQGFPVPIRSLGFKKLHIPPSQMSSSDKLYALDYWAGMWSSYNRMKLTHEDDKLIAISGLARELNTLLQDDYLAGLWRQNLEYQLLWKVKLPLQGNRRIKASRRPNIYRAPSWSWASVDAELWEPITRVTAPPNKILIPIKVLDAKVNPRDGDVFGRIKDGYLRVRGPLLKARFTTSSTDEIDFPPGTMEISVNSQVTCTAAADTADLKGQDKDCYCLPVALYADSTALQGLILQATFRTRGEFRRIGVFFADEPASISVFQQPGEMLDPEHFEQQDGDGQYVFTIV
jgi:Heterokaryon incompatibility protein (HET)